jgi:O-acetyl-ADP-ribose deacetylase (regulator of RNase III)
MHGAGVAGAIMRKGGYEVQKLSDKWVDEHGDVETGTAAWTLPGKMKNCKYIIHAVGPIWSNVSETHFNIFY